MDLQKAYTKVSKETVRQKFKRYGMGGKLLNSAKNIYVLDKIKWLER